MRARIEARLSRLESSPRNCLTERAKAWLGLRGPLSAEEEAAEPLRDRSAVDLSGCSPELRQWLAR